MTTISAGAASDPISPIVEASSSESIVAGLIDASWRLRYAEGVIEYSFLKSLMKCEVLGKAHSWPISETDLLVEIKSRRECINLCWMYHLWGGSSKWRLNSFLNEVSERLQISESCSIETSLNRWLYIICSKLPLATSILRISLLFRQQSP